MKNSRKRGMLLTWNTITVRTEHGNRLHRIDLWIGSADNFRVIGQEFYVRPVIGHQYLNIWFFIRIKKMPLALVESLKTKMSVCRVMIKSHFARGNIFSIKQFHGNHGLLTADGVGMLENIINQNRCIK